MFTTAQFRVFANEPSERALARARHLLREGDVGGAEEAYLDLIDQQPEMKLAWGEYFQLLRSRRRFEEALALSAQAADRFGDDPFPLALKGAALVELCRYREGLVALETAAGLDPGFGLVWHEAGYAAYRLGEYSRALMALDRAFALEPHSGTLHLRGKILRQAGRYLAAEVAFTGAAEAAEFSEQKDEAERQLSITRRYAAYHGHRPGELSATQRWFAETGAAVLTSPGRRETLSDLELLHAFATLSEEEGWRFDGLLRADAWPGWSALATALGIPVRDNLTGLTTPLVVARHPAPEEPLWQRAEVWIRTQAAGLSFVLVQPADGAWADIAGRLDEMTEAHLDLAAAGEAIQHPESRLLGRRLRSAD